MSEIKKYKIGDKVKICGNKINVRFDIGEEVEIINDILVKDSDKTYYATNGEFNQYVHIDDVENIEYDEIDKFFELLISMEEIIMNKSQNEYVGSDKENEFTYIGGEIVKIIDNGNAYTNYTDLATKMGLPNYVINVSPKEGSIGTVVGYLPHEEKDYDQIVGVDIDRQQYLIGINGVEKIDSINEDKSNDFEYEGSIMWAFEQLQKGNRVRHNIEEDVDDYYNEVYLTDMNGMDWLINKEYGDDLSVVLTDETLYGWELIE